jgi:hypothetical protein
MVKRNNVSQDHARGKRFKERVEEFIFALCPQDNAVLRGR